MNFVWLGGVELNRVNPYPVDVPAGSLTSPSRQVVRTKPPNMVVFHNFTTGQHNLRGNFADTGQDLQAFEVGRLRTVSPGLADQEVGQTIPSGLVRMKVVGGTITQIQFVDWTRITEVSGTWTAISVSSDTWTPIVNEP
jgi:hypothetical protein